jgi:hypothetical protein
MISRPHSPSLPVLSPTMPPSAASADGARPAGTDPRPAVRSALVEIVAAVRALSGDDAGDRLEHALRLVGP